MKLQLPEFTAVEWLIMAAIVAIVFVLAIASNTSDPVEYCKVRGGVPITDVSGRLTRCDFPVNVYGR